MYKLYINSNGYCMGYMINNEPLEDDIEVDQSLYPTDDSYLGRKFDPVNMCWLNEYADWYKAPPRPALSEAEQRELDRDELLLDSVINDQQIILLLESGGDRV